MNTERIKETALYKTHRWPRRDKIGPTLCNGVPSSLMGNHIMHTGCGSRPTNYYLLAPPHPTFFPTPFPTSFPLPCPLSSLCRVSIAHLIHRLPVAAHYRVCMCVCYVRALLAQLSGLFLRPPCMTERDRGGLRLLCPIPLRWCPRRGFSHLSCKLHLGD